MAMIIPSWLNLTQSINVIASDPAVYQEIRGFDLPRFFALLVYRLKINFSHACVLIAARARCILFKISSPLAFQT